MRCWGSSEPSRTGGIDFERSDCVMDTRIFVGEYNTGTISLRHESYDGSKLGAAALRLALLAELPQRVVLAPVGPAPDQAALQRGLRRPRRPAAARGRLHARLQEAAAAVRRRRCWSPRSTSRGRRAGPLRRPGRELRQRAAARPALPRRVPMGPAALPSPCRRDARCSRRSTATAWSRQAWRIERWPVTIGRALDNDVVLSDPHVAPHHATIDLVAGGRRRAGDARRHRRRRRRNGVTRRPRAIAGGAARAGRRRRPRPRAAHRPQPAAPAPARPCAGARAGAGAGRSSREIRWLPTLGLASPSLAFVLLNTWIETDPDGLGREPPAASCSAACRRRRCGAASGRCCRRPSPGRAASAGTCACSSSPAWPWRPRRVPPLLAFAFSWPWVTDFSFVAVIAAVAAAIYFHLLAVEPGAAAADAGVAAPASWSASRCRSGSTCSAPAGPARSST